MLAALLSAIFGGLIRWWQGRGPSTAQQLGAANEDVKQEGAALESIETTAAASAAADVQRVRDDPASEQVTADPAAPVNNLPGEVFRD